MSETPGSLVAKPAGRTHPAKVKFSRRGARVCGEIRYPLAVPWSTAWSKTAAVVLLAALAGFASLAGCSGANKSAGATTTVSTTTTTALPANLASVIFDQFPASYIEASIGLDGLVGSLDLAATAKAVDDKDVARATTDLEQYGFQRAYELVWVLKGTDDSLSIRVQLMGSASQAMGYFNVLSFGVRTSSALTAFSTPRLGTATGFTDDVTDSNGPRTVQSVYLVRGPLFYDLELIGPRGTIAPSAVLRAARSQSAEDASLGYD